MPMHIINFDNPFSLVDASPYIVPPLPKIVDNRGYIYILSDTTFWEYFKIGRTTDMHKRLQAYNTDKPYKTTFLHAISTPFHNAVDVEAKIIKAMYKVTSPTTFSKEWFEISHLPQAIALIQEAEKIFQLMESH